MDSEAPSPLPQEAAATDAASRLASAAEDMLFIRKFEEHLLAEFRSGALRGTTHTCIGQEAVSVASMAHIGPNDTVFGSHRAHGHFLAYGGDPAALLLEIRGEPGGVCGGQGGSQHLQWRNFFTNGVQGGIAPVSVGMAMAHRLSGRDGVAVCFLGDGTLGEGAVYESFNLAALWNAPILFVVEHNGIAQTTPSSLGIAGSVAERPRAFGISTEEIQTSDVAELDDFFGRAFDYVRQTGRPRCAIVHVQRLGPHSKGDDLRPPAMIEEMRKGDPLARALAALPPLTRVAVEASAEARLRQTVAGASQGGAPRAAAKITKADRASRPGWLEGEDHVLGIERLRSAIHRSMAEDERIHFIGEDVLDPYGGAFKASLGLSTDFPRRVHTTPISEAGIVGLANGLALSGLRPVVELMFGDFVTLAMDQIVNHMAKFAAMYDGHVRCPVILRLPMGGYRGYGPTHSQSLEKHLIGVPGLTVVAHSPLHDPDSLWRDALDEDGPVAMIENKTLYGRRLAPVARGRMGPFVVASDGGRFPTLRLSLAGQAPAGAVIVTYGAVADLALAAALERFEVAEEVVDVVIMSQLSPVPVEALAAAVGMTSRVLTLEEGGLTGGWGGEVGAILAARQRGVRLGRCAAVDGIIPNSASGEAAALPDLSKVLAALAEIR